jgi:hypothetical protein
MDDDVTLMDPDPQVVRVVRVQVPFADVFAVTAKVWLANVLMLWLVALVGALGAGGVALLLAVVGAAAVAA